MNMNCAGRTITVFIAVLLISNTVFFTGSQRARAVMGVADTNIIADLETGLTAVETGISAVENVTSAAAEYAQMINTYILEPLTYVMSGKLMKSITSGSISFVNGGSNGTGQAQYVQDLQRHNQTLGDTEANAFFVQFGKNSNSPFAASINSSLRSNYYQRTSLAGFFSANRDTLPQYSQNPRAYLAGNWSQGGAGAWFALTTQPQNNPYMLHQRAQAELSLMVQDAVSARAQELMWGDGFLSWCGDSEGSSGADSSSSDGTVKSGDSCTKEDGTAGTIKTPGSTIKATLDKALSLDADKIAQMGNTSAQINSIMGNISTLMNTANFASGLLGGASGSGGLAGATETRPDGSTFLDDYGSLGIDETEITDSAAQNPSMNGTYFLETVDKFESSWNTIRVAANTASTSGQALREEVLAYPNCPASFFTSSSTSPTADADKVDKALADTVAPVLAKADAAAIIIANARAFVEKLRAEAASTEAGATEAYTIDLVKLKTMSPTGSDAARANQQALVTNQAVADPEGTISIVKDKGTTIDQMALFSKNSDSLLSYCTYWRTPRGNGTGPNDPPPAP